MIDVELHCIDIDKGGIPVIFEMKPDVVLGYETCAWSETGKNNIIRLTFDAYHEWVINTNDKTAVHVISNLKNGIERHAYTFVKLIIT